VTLRVLPGGRGAPDEEPRGTLIVGAGRLATMAGGLRRGSAQADAAVIEGRPALAAWEGRIVAVGQVDAVRRQLTEEGLDEGDLTVVDARGGTLTPGLIDPHTHLLFSGTREREIALRQAGAGYLDILAAGGGILSTVDETRAASPAELHSHGRHWLEQMLGHGVTTLEAKTGYGLDVPTELRLLDTYRHLDREGPVEIVPTFLGAHAVPREYRERPDAVAAYVRSVIDEQLPRVAEQGIARFCDVFCERGVFSADQSREILEAGRRAGLEPRLHADELAPSGGAELAAELRAASADHLSAVSDEGVSAMAEAAEDGAPVVATLLPGTSLFLGTGHEAAARTWIERGVPVALGTDFNPGTSPTASLPLVMSLAVLRLAMTPAEALAAVTINAAHALGLGETHGALEPGRQADVVIWDVPGPDLIPYWLGADMVRAVIKRGRVVILREPGR
jgi:imidazolonepropionase